MAKNTNNHKIWWAQVISGRHQRENPRCDEQCIQSRDTWEFTDRNPITGPTKGSGVRVSAKRERTPDVLEVDEMQRLLEALEVRERAMVFLDMALGLRRGELAGLKWEDVDFERLCVNVTRSVVDQQVGNTKTEVSRKPVPIDNFLVKDLLTWHEQTPYKAPSDWVFATDSRPEQIGANSLFG
jgi:integrase